MKGKEFKLDDNRRHYRPVDDQILDKLNQDMTKYWDKRDGGLVDPSEESDLAFALFREGRELLKEVIEERANRKRTLLGPIEFDAPMPLIDRIIFAKFPVIESLHFYKRCPAGWLIEHDEVGLLINHDPEWWAAVDPEVYKQLKEGRKDELHIRKSGDVAGGADEAS